MDTDVIVVGAGPVGLMLAGELRLAGTGVAVVERLHEPTGESRASQLNSRTMEVFDQRGLLDALGTVEYQPAGHFGGLGVDVSGVDSAHAGHWKVPQFRTEAMLEKWARDLGVDIRRGHQLCNLMVSEDHVEVEVDGPDGLTHGRARYVVGCDGERSTVRNLAGFDFPGTDATRELLRADVSGIDIPDRRFQRYERGLAIAARRPDGVTRVMTHEFGRTAQPRTGQPDFAEIYAAWSRVTGEDISQATPVWVDVFGDASRQVTHYRNGRVLLAGDAAHVQMPTGGQALNLGVQDAVNLGWKLAAHVHGWAPAGLLDSYHNERHPLGARILNNVAAQVHLLLGGPDVQPQREVMGELLELHGTRDHLAGLLTGLDVRYDVGSGNHPLLGARLPHHELVPPSGSASTTAALRSGFGLLLELTPTTLARDIVAPWTDRIRTVTASRPTAGPLSELERVLVRPDGHVVAVDPPSEELENALSRWFGPPDATPRRERDGQTPPSGR